VGKSTTIAITKQVYTDLLKFVHYLEFKEKKRISMSDAIACLLKYVEEL
jgi:predicted CopG family antitoxin